MAYGTDFLAYAGSGDRLVPRSRIAFLLPTIVAISLGAWAWSTRADVERTLDKGAWRRWPRSLGERPLTASRIDRSLSAQPEMNSPRIKGPQAQSPGTEILTGLGSRVSGSRQLWIWAFCVGICAIRSVVPAAAAASNSANASKQSWQRLSNPISADTPIAIPGPATIWGFANFRGDGDWALRCADNYFNVKRTYLEIDQNQSSGGF